MAALAKQYYLIRIGTSTRVSEKCATPLEAARYCFGPMNFGIAGASYKAIGTRAPRYATAKQKQEWHSDDGWIVFGNKPKKQPIAIASQISKLTGELEIDHARGVIYFHGIDGVTFLRICKLPKPIPSLSIDPDNFRTLDITHMAGTSWGQSNG